jgi:glycerophosphoryl diester phosphodiesterase
LKDVLELAKEKNVGVYIETKHPTYFRNLGFRMEEMILDLLKTSGFLNFPDRVFIQSFEVANLKRIRSVSNIPLIQLFDSFEESPFDSLQPGAEKITYLQMASVEGLREVTKYAAGIGPWKQLLIDSNGKSTGFSERAQALGLLVHPYTFRSDQENLLPRYKGDHLNEYREYINLKVNGFFTDFPDHAARALKEAN